MVVAVVLQPLSWMNMSRARAAPISCFSWSWLIAESPGSSMTAAPPVQVGRLNWMPPESDAEPRMRLPRAQARKFDSHAPLDVPVAKILPRSVQYLDSTWSMT